MEETQKITVDPIKQEPLNNAVEKEACNLMLQGLGIDPASHPNMELHTMPPKHIMKQAKQNIKKRQEPKVTLKDVLGELEDDEEDEKEDDERSETPETKLQSVLDIMSEDPRKVPLPKFLQAMDDAYPGINEEVTKEQRLKQCVDRMLLCYCRMQEHVEEHEEDFSDSEVEAVTDMAIDLLVRVFPRLTGHSDEQTKTKALNYLKIYYELFKLKQTESRRQQFLDEFTDVIRLGEMEDFFLETSLEMAKPILEFSQRLDAQVNGAKPQATERSAAKRVHVGKSKSRRR